MELSLSALIFAILVVSAVVIGMMEFSGNVLIVNYPTANVSNYTILSKLNETYNTTQDIYNTELGASETQTADGAASYIKGGWDTFLKFFDFLNIFKKMTSAAETEGVSPVALPSWFTTLIALGSVILIIFIGLKFMGKVNI